MDSVADVVLPEIITQPLERSWTVEEAFAYCTRLTKGHYENFPVGSLLMPSELQPAVHSLYAFMRTADDFSDENRRPGDETERAAYLEAWDRMLAECEQGQARHPVFVALAVTLEKYKLPVQWLRDLLHAFKMDVTKRRYETQDEVLEYCRYSANPVGRLILTLFGYRDEERYAWSDAICTGLQLANHWQDVAVDLRKDRIYLPQHDLRQFQLSDDILMNWLEIAPESRSPEWDAFRQIMRLQIARARAFFQRGKPLPAGVKGRLKLELAMTWRGGVSIIDKIQSVDYDVFRHRPTVNRRDWMELGWKTVKAWGL